MESSAKPTTTTACHSLVARNVTQRNAWRALNVYALEPKTV